MREIEKYIVEKSRALYLMKEVPFSLGEMRVLELYLSRINARDENSRTVVFKKSEYEEIMGIERTREETINKYLKSMMGKTVTVPEIGFDNNWDIYTLFTRARCYKDVDGEYKISLTCTEEAKKLFFNLEGVGYLKYQLKNVIILQKKYSMLLYFYLLDNRFRKDWRTSLDLLKKEVFRCDSKAYDAFKYFKRDVLQPAINEINHLTDLEFDYKPIRKGARVEEIEFILISDDMIDFSLQDENIIPTQGEILSQDVITEKFENKMLEFMAEACRNEFNEKEMGVIHDFVVNTLKSNGQNIDELTKYDYLSMKYHELEARATRRDLRPIKSRFSYLKRLIKSDMNKGG